MQTLLYSQVFSGSKVAVHDGIALVPMGQTWIARDGHGRVRRLNPASITSYDKQERARV